MSTNSRKCEVDSQKEPDIILPLMMFRARYTTVHIPENLLLICCAILSMIDQDVSVISLRLV